MRVSWKGGWHALLAACLLTFVGCGTPQHDEHFDEDLTLLTDAKPVTFSEALDLAITAGVEQERLIYSDLLPYIVSSTETLDTWGFIESTADRELVTYLDYWSGEILELQQEPSENIMDFLNGGGIEEEDDDFIARAQPEGSEPNTYNSYPWNWRLPMEKGGFYMTCGYGCGAHQGNIKHSTDWAKSPAGHLLESPASGWVKSIRNYEGYGWQVLVEAGNAGSGKRYYYRVGHLRDKPKVTPGWWIGKGRDLGYMGCTGNCSGPHVHYEAIRGTGTGTGYYDAHVYNGATVPITKWPSSKDGICDGKLNKYNMNGSPWFKLNVQSNGCP